MDNAFIPLIKNGNVCKGQQINLRCTLQGCQPLKKKFVLNCIKVPFRYQKDTIIKGHITKPDLKIEWYLHGYAQLRLIFNVEHWCILIIIYCGTPKSERPNIKNHQKSNSFCEQKISVSRHF